MVAGNLVYHTGHHHSLQSISGPGDGGAAGIDLEQSTMANEEVVLFLFQLQLDQEMQRAMTYENYQAAMEMRSRREQVDPFAHPNSNQVWQD